MSETPKDLALGAPELQQAAGVLAFLAATVALGFTLAVPPAGLFFVPFAVYIAFTGYRSFTLRVRASSDGLVVRNHFRTYEIGWREVEAFQIQRAMAGYNSPSTLGFSGLMIVVIYVDAVRPPTRLAASFMPGTNERPKQQQRVDELEAMRCLFVQD